MIRFVSVIATLGWASFGVAQLYPSPFSLTESVAFRMANHRVQAELGIGSTQAKLISEVIKVNSGELARLDAQVSKASGTQREALSRDYELQELKAARKLVAVLRPVQKARLLELAVQDTGPFALRNKHIAKMVRLSPDQTAKIDAIAKKTVADLDRANEQLFAQFQKTPAGQSGQQERARLEGEFFAQSSRSQTKAESQVLALLSKAQLESWRKVQGRPFKI